MTDAALGALMVRYSDAKRRRAGLVDAVQATTKRISEALRPILGMMTDLRFLTAEGVPAFVEYPAGQVIADQLHELRTACQDFELATQQLADAGIDLTGEGIS